MSIFLIRPYCGAEMTFALQQQHHLYLVSMYACIFQNPLNLIKEFMKTHPYSPIPRNAYTPIPTKAKQSHTHTRAKKICTKLVYHSLC